MKASLADKAIDIKGKKYVLVSDRVLYFNETYPEGYIDTQLVSDPTSEMVIVKARVWPDAAQTGRSFTGHSQAVVGDGMVNKTAALENAETSAVGRALAMMGIGVIESIASADEMNKAIGSTGFKTPSQKQLDWIYSIAGKVSGSENADDINAWIEKNLQINPLTMPGWKTADLVKKIQEIGKALDQQELTPEPVIDNIEGEINLDDIPY